MEQCRDVEQRRAGNTVYWVVNAESVGDTKVTRDEARDFG